MSTILLVGTLTTVGPLSIKLPVAKGQLSNRWDNFPVETRGVDAEGVKKQSGYLPATTLRGFLRRAIVTDQMRHAADAGEHYSLSRAYADLIGQDAESEEKGPVDLLKLKAIRDENAVLDLFGAGMSLASRILVSNFRPDQLVLPDVITGVRKDLEDTDGVLDTLVPADCDAYFNRSAANSKRAGAAALVATLEAKLKKAERAKEPTDDLKSALEEAKAMLKAYTEEMGDMANSSRTLTSYWALPAGIELKGKIVIERARERDLPMLELALNALSLRPMLGGQVARGCGEVEGEFDVLVDGELFKKISIGGWKPAEIREI